MNSDLHSSQLEDLRQQAYELRRSALLAYTGAPGHSDPLHTLCTATAIEDRLLREHGIRPIPQEPTEQLGYRVDLTQYMPSIQHKELKQESIEREATQLRVQPHVSEKTMKAQRKPMPEAGQLFLF